MRKRKTFLLGAFISFAVLMGSAYVIGCSPQKVVDIGNKICPVSDEAIGSMGEGYEVVHEGKRYKLCCEGCEEAFKKHPEKYIKKLEDLEDLL